MISDYRSGRDLIEASRQLKVLDLYGLSLEEARTKYPSVYQHLKDHVKPERDQNRKKVYRENWWFFGEPQPALRDGLKGLSRYIATPALAKHRFFVFLDSSVVTNNTTRAIALGDAFHLGVLSSHIHIVWSLAAGGRMGVGNDPRYTNSRCFDPFPFPVATDSQRECIRQIAERLDRHRAERLDAHESLTMTALYNVLEQVRAGEALSEDERVVYEQGLVGVLRELHDELDAAVAEAYGWPADLDDEEILYRLVALNKERRAEEEQGLVRYLRPEYQNPEAAAQQALEIEVETDGKEVVAERLPWPSTLSQRALTLQLTLARIDQPVTVEELAQHFHRAQRKQVHGLLETLEALGHVRQTEEGRYVA